MDDDRGTGRALTFTMSMWVTVGTPGSLGRAREPKGTQVQFFFRLLAARVTRRWRPRSASSKPRVIDGAFCKDNNLNGAGPCCLGEVLAGKEFRLTAAPVAPRKQGVCQTTLTGQGEALHWLPMAYRRHSRHGHAGPPAGRRAAQLATRSLQPILRLVPMWRMMIMLLCTG